MKTLLTLSLVHLFVAVTFWRHGESKVLEVHCTLAWLQVNLKALTIGDWYLLSDEVFLGHGCPVTNVYEDVYMFLYPTSDCDIKSQVFRRKIIFRTQLTFISRTTSMRGFTPISCTVKREKSSSLPVTSFIHPRQAEWLASPTYQEFYNSIKCSNICCSTSRNFSGTACKMLNEEVSNIIRSLACPINIGMTADI